MLDQFVGRGEDRLTLPAFLQIVSDIAEQWKQREDGYNLWRRAFDAGEGGVFTLTVAESIDAMEQVMNTAPESRQAG